MQAEPVRVFIVSDHPLIRDGLQPRVGEITDVTASPYLSAVLGAAEATSFWKRGSFRSGSNIGSSRSRAGVSGAFEASAPPYGIESSFCKTATARSGSPMRA